MEDSAQAYAKMIWIDRVKYYLMANRNAIDTWAIGTPITLAEFQGAHFIAHAADERLGKRIDFYLMNEYVTTFTFGGTGEAPIFPFPPSHIAPQ